MLALVQRNSADGKPTLSKDTIDKPQLRGNQLLVKISHAAQNPTDGMDRTNEVSTPTNRAIVQSLDSNAFGDGAVLGCDFAGAVEETGSDVRRASKGDVVAGLIWGGMFYTTLQSSPRY